jgi:hypothetical protein
MNIAAINFFNLQLQFAAKGNESYHHHRGTLSRIQVCALLFLSRSVFLFSSQHSASFTLAQMAIRERVADVGSSHRNNRELLFNDSYKGCDALIESVLSLLEADDQMNPVSVVGIRATTQLQVLLVSVMLSLFTIGVRLLTGSIG